jgi:hypothetical protein
MFTGLSGTIFKQSVRSKERRRMKQTRKEYGTKERDRDTKRIMESMEEG